MTARLARPVTFVAIVGGSLVSGLATAEPLTDLRGIVVGMTARDLPVVGYRDVACIAGRPLATWSDWASCPAGPDGLHAVRVAYDQPGEATKVAGHPVDLTVFFDGAGRLARIETNDRVAPFLHKKAYMLATQAKAHYGEDGWTCKNLNAEPDEEPLGTLYVNETCTKLSPERRIEMSDRLYRLKGSAPRNFVSETKLSIAAASPGSK